MLAVTVRYVPFQLESLKLRLAALDDDKTCTLELHNTPYDRSEGFLKSSKSLPQKLKV